MIPLVKSSGWAANEKLTSAQISQIDLHTSWAIDKRLGQTDTVQSELTFDSNAVLGISGGVLVVNSGGFFQINASGFAVFKGSAEFQSTAVTTFDGGSVTNFGTGTGSAATVNIKALSSVVVQAGAFIDVLPDGSISVSGTSGHPGVIGIDSHSAILSAGTLTQSGASAFSGAVSITAALTGSGASSCTWSGTWTFDGTTIFNNVSVGLSSGSTFTHDATSHSVRLGSALVSGSSATTTWRIGQTADASGTYGVEQDEWVVNYTGAHNYTLRESTTPAPAAGMKLRFSAIHSGAGASITFKREDGTTLAVTPSSTSVWWVDFSYRQDSGEITPRWHVAAWSGAGGDFSSLS